MRTNIVIDEKLMKQAMKAANLPTKRATVEEGLRLIIRRKKLSGIRSLRGTVDWQGDLDAWRRDE
jgi:Arc/MetJ family transcription regulator